ncbi:hypothetical protein [Mycolicibacterium iranicum]|uniref:Uncharacterized protein n=1 Tax=Mycolicibacterium iranicum TaxID=912594 RepID=A0A178LUJ8_MYCIR|nr:hypothetical protein [Mycolicibacterium iranicum]OAN37670.1 hypothetical protein A4X20_21215 [Mycolicibacterium iranicum]
MADGAGDLVGEMTDADKQRISELLGQIGGPNVMWGSVNYLEVWLTEHRVRAERKSSERLTRATWVLSAATVVLALATVALVFATVAAV